MNVSRDSADSGIRTPTTIASLAGLKKEVTKAAMYNRANNKNVSGMMRSGSFTSIGGLGYEPV